MNERIRELIEEATSSRYQHDPKTMMTDRVQEFNKAKFAELIVREATDIVYRMLDDNTGAEVVVAVKEHFGVE